MLTDPTDQETVALESDFISMNSKKHEGIFYQPNLIKAEAVGGTLKIDIKKSSKMPRSPYMPINQPCSNLVTAPTTRNSHQDNATQIRVDIIDMKNLSKLHESKCKSIFKVSEESKTPVTEEF